MKSGNPYLKEHGQGSPPHCEMDQHEVSQIGLLVMNYVGVISLIQRCGSLRVQQKQIAGTWNELSAEADCSIVMRAASGY